LLALSDGAATGLVIGGEVPGLAGIGLVRAGKMVTVDDVLAAELLERAARDQAARESLPPGAGMQQREQLVEPVDRANTARLREIVGEHGWPGHQLVGEMAAHAAWLLAQHAPPGHQEQYLPLLEDAVARAMPAHGTGPI
jgi:Family of unknown function (DUF6624)